MHRWSDVNPIACQIQVNEAQVVMCTGEAKRNVWKGICIQPTVVLGHFFFYPPFFSFTKFRICSKKSWRVGNTRLSEQSAHLERCEWGNVTKGNICTSIPGVETIFQDKFPFVYSFSYWIPIHIFIKIRLRRAQPWVNLKFLGTRISTLLRSKLMDLNVFVL